MQRVVEVSEPALDDVVGMHADQALAILRERFCEPVLRLSTASLTQGAGEGMVTGARPQPADQMDAGELQAVREYLGLTTQQLAEALSVRHDTLRRWESGRESIPRRVRTELEALEDAAARAVDALAGDLERDPTMVATVYRTDVAWREARPDLHGVPARWWRHVVMRALELVDRDVTVVGR